MSRRQTLGQLRQPVDDAQLIGPQQHFHKGQKHPRIDRHRPRHIKDRDQPHRPVRAVAVEQPQRLMRRGQRRHQVADAGAGQPPFAALFYLARLPGIGLISPAAARLAILRRPGGCRALAFGSPRRFIRPFPPPGSAIRREKVVEPRKILLRAATWAGGSPPAGAAPAGTVPRISAPRLPPPSRRPDGRGDHHVGCNAIFAYIRANHLAAFTTFHRDDENGSETGCNLVQIDGRQARLFGQNGIDGILDLVFHIGFAIHNGRFVNEDGDATAGNVAFWPDSLLRADPASGGLANPACDPQVLVAQVERQLLTGSATINGTGNTAANSIRGNAGSVRPLVRPPAATGGPECRPFR